MLGADIISYLVHFQNQIDNNAWKLDQYRTQRLQINNKFSLSKLLVSPIKILEWSTQGLPLDSFSIDNACIYQITNKPIYLIDPEC